MTKQKPVESKIETKKNPTAKERGQVAIFVALIFQVLFVFFAMLVNVGLLVHHKINLQNSVDIAAYYGAMKQAEMLNVIAHSNYQIRQSWKLLVFRYRHLGTYGDDHYPGARNVDNQASDGGVSSGISNSSNTQDPNMFPAFCITYHPFQFMSPNENYCRHSGQQGQFIIKTPPVPTHVGTNFLGLISWDQLNIAITQNIRAQVQTSCESKQALSYYQIAQFLFAYKRDIANRKRLITTLANQLSGSTSDFNDLDGNSVIDGVEKTLTKNLTYQNLSGAQKINGAHIVKFFNSMGGTAGSQYAPPQWLSEIRIFPIFWAYVGECTLDQLSYVATPINIGNPPPLPIAQDKIVGTQIVAIDQQIQEPGPGSSATAQLYASSLGYEKNPWYMPYVAVHAETKPQIPFSPFGTVTLKATAYAKPFGGMIGPWWGKDWGSASPMSDNGNPNDSTLQPPRMTTPDGLPDPKDPRYTPDTVRYVGDKIGTQSYLNMYQYSKVLNAIPDGKMSLFFWSHLVSSSDDLEQIGTNGDMLAWANADSDQQTAQTMRNLELQVISPDQYDISYYSIEPDYYRNYYLRLKKLEGSQNYNFPIRGDLGQRAKDATLVNFSVKDQIKAAQSFSNAGGMDLTTALSYFARTPAELLTSYKSTAPDNTNMDTQNNFGKCAIQPQDTDPAIMATPGNCIAGGRVGYSVKLVDGDFLASSELPLGGLGASSSAIKNPPPSF
jgi:hypothetical protein